MNNKIKIKSIFPNVLLAIPVLILIYGGVVKLLGKEPEDVMQFLTQMGFSNYIIQLGLIELIIAGLLIYPKTLKIGFLLVSSYFGGAFCLEIAGSKPFIAPVFLAILWVAIFFKNKEMFLTTSKIDIK